MTVVLSAGVATAATVTVQVGPGNSLTFAPATATIDVGDTVEWRWMSGPHTTTSNQGVEQWDSGVADAPHSFSHTFTHSGTFPYVCSLHSALGMTGAVHVRSSTGSTTLPPASGACDSVSTCEAALRAALPATAAATSADQRRVARTLARLADAASAQLTRAAAGSGSKRKHLVTRSRHTLQRLRQAADKAAKKGTLGVPIAPVDAIVDQLVALDV